MSDAFCTEFDASHWFSERMDQSEIENKSGIFFTSSSDVFHFSKLQQSADKM